MFCPTYSSAALRPCYVVPRYNGTRMHYERTNEFLCESAFENWSLGNFLKIFWRIWCRLDCHPSCEINVSFSCSDCQPEKQLVSLVNISTTFFEYFVCCHWTDHDDVIKWKKFPRYLPFVRGIHRWPMKSPHKGQWCGALIFFHLRPNKRLSKHNDAIVMLCTSSFYIVVVLSFLSATGFLFGVFFVVNAGE